MSLNSVRIPGLIQPHQHCDNGLYPDATFYGRTTLAVNHCLSYRRKLVYQRTWKLGASGGATGVVGWWHCHTGHGAKRFSVMAVLGLDDRLLATEPYIKVTMTKTAGSPASVEFHGGASDIASVDAPDQMIVQRATIPADADSTYTGEVEFFDNVRVISLLVFEDYEVTVDDSTDFFIEHEPGAGSPIYDGWIGRQLQAVTGMHRSNRGLRGDWHQPANSLRTRTSATMINLFDNTTTGTPSSSSPGWVLATTSRNTASSAVVPILFAVYAEIAGGTGTVVLRDTTGADAASVSITSATPEWVTVSGELPVSAGAKVDPMFASDGTNLLTVYALSFYEYDPLPSAVASLDWGLLTDAVGATADWGLLTDAVSASNDWGPL